VNGKPSKKSLILIASLLALGLCLAASFILLSSGLTFWAAIRGAEADAATQPQPTRRTFALAELPPPPTATATPPPTATPTAALLLGQPTAPPTNTPLPAPTDTPAPTPTETLPPTPRPPTATPLPIDTPTPPPPTYPFSIKETASFPTNHLSFDVYIAITDNKNKPLRDYRVIGTHASGLQIESQVSAGDWTVNSGAMHYKAGNIKYEAPNSPSGLWTLQLVDAENKPAGPPVEFSFDLENPTWYFLIYERQ
jgi:hypothetical protein